MVCGEVGLCGSTIGVTEAPTDIALGRAFKVLASAIRLDESITDAAPNKRKSKGLELIPVKGTYSTYRNLDQTNSTYNNHRKHIKRRI